MNHIFTVWVSTQYVTRKPRSHRKKTGGSGTRPMKLASGENGSQQPIAMTNSVVNVVVLLARLWKNGIRCVRMI